MPILIAFIIVGVIIASSAAKNKKRQEEIKRAAAAAQRKKPAPAPAEGQSSRPQESEIERRLRQEELKRRLQANAERRAAEQQYAERRQAAGMPPAAPAPAPARQPLVKQELRRDMSRPDKPVVVHSEDDCTGGSIHDGYHEGVSSFSPKDSPRPVSTAGALGHRLADEDERIEREAAAVENAKRVMERISKLPPLAQGMVYSEILGRPKSDSAA